MDARPAALIVVSYDYQDPGLRRLRAQRMPRRSLGCSAIPRSATSTCERCSTNPSGGLAGLHFEGNLAGPTIRPNSGTYSVRLHFDRSTSWRRAPCVRSHAFVLHSGGFRAYAGGRRSMGDLSALALGDEAAAAFQRPSPAQHEQVVQLRRAVCPQDVLGQFERDAFTQMAAVIQLAGIVLNTGEACLIHFFEQPRHLGDRWWLRFG